jgi:hypothetical protein
MASSSPTVGSVAIADLGQGCWAGGALLANGTVTGDGSCAFSTPLGPEALVFTSKTWSGDATSGITVCVTVRDVHDPLGIGTDLGCVGPIPANVGPVKITGPDGGTTLVRATLR